jgi:hypothetical protein
MDLSDKQALLEKALEMKMLADRFSQEFSDAKAALKRVMDMDGDHKVSTEDDGLAFYKESTTRKFKGVKALDKLPKNALLAVLAETKVTVKQVNILSQTAKGVKIDSLMTTGKSRSFTVTLPQDAEKKERIQRRIEERAEEELADVNSRVRSVSKLGRKGARKKKAAKKKRAKSK